MKVRYSPLLATIVAAFIGTAVAMPAQSATGSPTSTQHAQTLHRQKSHMAQPSGKSKSTSKPDVCARLDTNHDGYISQTEFKASGKSKYDFRLADISGHGKLTMKECDMALKG